MDYWEIEQDRHILQNMSYRMVSPDINKKKMNFQLKHLF